MNATVINCPKCQHEFPLNAAIEQPILQKLRVQFETDALKKEEAFRAREEQIAQKAREAVSLQMRDLEQQVVDKDRKLRESQALQLQVLKQRRELDEQKVAFELDKARQIDAEREKIRTEAAKTATERATAQMRTMQELLEQKEKMLIESQQAELKLRSEREQFEEQKRAFELELARRADEVAVTVKKQKDEEFRLKLAEKDKQLEDVTRQLDDAKRTAEQGSQQTQGEVLELDLEVSLRRCFITDSFVAVPKGTHGGDLVHQVRDESGSDCGSIVWESKRTKNFSDGWLSKLKDDKIAARAQIAVLVSTAMPKDLMNFGCREHVWITPPHLAVPLAAALRLVLIETAAAKRAIDGRHGKMEVVYDYLSGPHFKQRVTAIVEAFTAMREDLETEKKAMQRIWAKREKQLERVMVNTAGMYGDLSGIIGNSLPAIETLELTALPEPDSSELQLPA